MDRNSLYLISLTILNTLSVSILAALNEARLDVYISMFVLIYFALTAIFKPRRRTFDFLAIALFIS
ncbi:MAG: hypothetical protein NZ922_05785, partial [Candidatus Methanomethyliaceae archaeon]|nr:hypothetical protein [Candidatus Methanomethyliaceae archaeon]MDW7971366.1 hypothetical protein [Nitrososphaerota archaeon]